MDIIVDPSIYRADFSAQDDIPGFAEQSVLLRMTFFGLTGVELYSG
jgi:hypothetical protein